MLLKIYIVLRKDYDKEGDYKKMLLMVGGPHMVYELKRKIEKEFSELFPHEPPFVVAKLEDRNGFALSNNS